MRYDTRSVTGRARNANHDCAGALCDGERGLFVITDGTSKTGSGQLAEHFVKGVLATYQKHLDQGGISLSMEQWSRYFAQCLPSFTPLCLRPRQGRRVIWSVSLLMESSRLHMRVTVRVEW